MRSKKKDSSRVKKALFFRKSFMFICLLLIIGIAIFFVRKNNKSTIKPTVIIPSTTTATASLSILPSSSHIKHVFVIMQENTDWSTIKGNNQTPYINSLLSGFAHAENYHTSDHPSLPNYITLEAGTNVGMTNGDAEPGTTYINSTEHLTTQMKHAGISWKYYAENLPGNGDICNLDDPGTPYSEDHNPFVYFADVSGNPPNSHNSYCINHERPYKEFSQNLQNNTTPDYSFIVPNDYDQGEKTAPGSNCAICQSDNWLKKEIPKIQASQSYKDGGIIFVLWDEGASPAHNPSGLIVISQYAKKGYANNIMYSHASTVRTIEEIFGLRPFLNQAATANDLGDLFTIPISD